MPPPARPERILQLQSLRFFAAFAVLFGHALMQAREAGTAVPDRLYDLPWGAGVEVFFLISGFIILHIGRHVPPGASHALDFLGRRVIRIAPLYWLFTGLMIVALASGLADRSGQTVSATTVSQSLLFVPYTLPGVTPGRPLLEQGWTLNFEMAFYTLAALSILLAPRLRYAAVACALAATVLAGRLFALPPHLELLFGPLLLLFAIGATAAALGDRLPSLDRSSALALIGVALGYMALMPMPANPFGWWPLVARGLPATVIFVAFLRMRDPPSALREGLLPRLGDASYALYISHPFVVKAGFPIAARLGLGQGALAIGLCVVGACAASLLVTRLVEWPMTHALNRRWAGLFARANAAGRLTRQEPAMEVTRRW